MPIQTNQEILLLLDRLQSETTEELESQWLDFKPWIDKKDAQKTAVEYAVCFANAEGGAVIFGVTSKVKGRINAIHGVDNYDLDIFRRGIYDSTRPHITVSVDELAVPEGTGTLLVVRVEKGDIPPYGTSQGLFKKRVEKNCLPLDPTEFLSARISSGAVDWSGQPVEGISINDLDQLEIARARSVLRGKAPDSDLLRLPDLEFLQGLEAIRQNKITNTGLLLFGRLELLAEICPQHQVHYVHQVSDTKVARNDFMKLGLLNILERFEQTFSGPINPEEELSVGLFKLRIPAFPLDVVREAILNAITHRDYSHPDEILIRHSQHEIAVTSPGGFIGGITLSNILRHEPVRRNKTLANAFAKLRLVESAGFGRRRIFIPMLSFGKKPPIYESDNSQVTLRLFNGSYDARMAGLIAKWNSEGKEIGLDELLVLTYLKESAFINSITASDLLQVTREKARSLLEQMQINIGILERKGQTNAATYHLAKSVASDLLGKVAYSKTRGLNPVRYAEMVRQFVSDHGSITAAQCRELLGLGDSPTAKVQASKYLKRWSGEEGFLRRVGKPPNQHYYVLADSI